MSQEPRAKNILITGGAGFIGSNLVKYLLDRGDYNITVYDNFSTGSKDNLDRAINDSKQKGTVKIINGNILDFDKISEATKKQDAVVHLAAHTRVLESLENPKNNININTKGTFNVLEAARKNKVDKFIFASSNAAVGEQIPPINEKMIPKPLSPYGASKLFGEALCSAYYNSYGIKTAALRFANAYGPYSEHKTSVIAKFIKRLRKGKSLEIYGDGNQTRDFIHASDIAQAIYLCLSYNRSPNTDNRTPITEPWREVFQVATGIETKIIDLANMMKDLMQGKEDLEFTEERKGEIKENYSDITKIKKALGFKPKINLKDGLEGLTNQIT
jgi:UDP-glucose 4-epimerase